MTPEELRAVANRMAHSLGISLYIRDGWIYQTGPGERVHPPKTAHSGSHGRFQIEAAARPTVKI
jgi:hypothetical protein